MYMEDKVTLPDHDYVIAPQHILIPSVIWRFCNLSWSYVLCHTKCKIFWLQYLSPSAWHETYTMSWNIKWQFQKWYRSIETSHDSYRQWRSRQKSKIQNNIKWAIHYFTTQEFNAFFPETNAPGRSASNRVECQMVKFSQELSGIVLPYHKFGSHLSSNWETIKPELKKKNFIDAGKILSEMWSGHPVLIKYINEEAEEEIRKKSLEWKNNHILESQYFLQIVKCLDEITLDYSVPVI